MNLPLIYNRDGSLAHDGWIHIVPKGELPNKEAGIVQVLDDTSLDAIVSAVRGQERRFGNHWPGVYLGEEHFIYDPEKSSQAFGWAKEIEKRGDGIWAKPEWTDVGRPAIQNKRFKYTSFVADPRDLEPAGGVSETGLPRFRVTAIETVGLTNLPNGKHLLKPITNRGHELHELGKEGFLRDTLKGGHRTGFRHGLEAEAGSKDKDRETKIKNKMKNIATMLALSAEASEEAILAEVTKLKNRAVEAEGKITPLTERVTVLGAENKTLLEEQVDGILSEHGVKDAKVINRLKPLMLPLKNREERVACLSDLGIKADKSAKNQSGKVLNRADAGQPGSGAGAGGDDKAQADKIVNRANELRGSNRDRSWDDCFTQATREAVQA